MKDRDEKHLRYVVDGLNALYPAEITVVETLNGWDIRLKRGIDVVRHSLVLTVLDAVLVLRGIGMVLSAFYTPELKSKGDTPLQALRKLWR